MKAQLILQDGTRFTGVSFGKEGTVLTEVVFNTSLSGYEGVWTDPSYAGQCIVMTHPLTGNIGINRKDMEAIRPYCDGVVARYVSQSPSHWRSTGRVADWFRQNGLFLIGEVDTRMLTRHIRRHGSMKGLVTTEELSEEEIAAELTKPLNCERVARVSRREATVIPGRGPRIAIVDFGVKSGIVRELVERNCEVVIVPYDTTGEDLMSLCPDGVVLSNGPGNPEDVQSVVPTVQGLMSRGVPLFGICLGHQLMALACGARTERMLFGHRGGNHPVQEVESKRGWMTAQNHSYTVTRDSVIGTDLEVTYVSLHDGTIEGLRHVYQPAFSVQFHPEASSGPRDTVHLFDRFLALVAADNIH